VQNIPDLLNESPITSVENILDYTQIRFHNGATFNIFNRFSIASEETAADLVGTFIVSVSTSPTSLTFVCSSGAILKIGMHDADFAGPEAAMLALPSGEQIVW
jgi:hypothetical protein